MDPWQKHVDLSKICFQESSGRKFCSKIIQGLPTKIANFYLLKEGFLNKIVARTFCWDFVSTFLSKHYVKGPMSWYNFFLNVLPGPPDKTEKQRENFTLENVFYKSNFQTPFGLWT